MPFSPAAPASPRWHYIDALAGAARIGTLRSNLPTGHPSPRFSRLAFGSPSETALPHKGGGGAPSWFIGSPTSRGAPGMTAYATALPYAPRRRGVIARFFGSSFVAVTVVVIAIIGLWYLGAALLNAPVQRDMFARQKVEPTMEEFVKATWAQERPVLPAPHQVAIEIYKTTALLAPDSKRSLVYHGWITLSSTLLGFVMGTILGILLAVAIVHVPSLDRSLMPWVVSSQTIPILAIAPMIIVVLGSVGLTGLVPKSIISTYLSFFPVAIGMAKGLRSPDPMQLDLMRTYSADRWQTFWKLRWPSLGAVPVRIDEDRGRREPRRRHRRRIADRIGRRPRRPHADRFLLWPDHPDLVRAGRRLGDGRRPRRHRRHRRAHRHRPHGDEAGMSGSISVTLAERGRTVRIAKDWTPSHPPPFWGRGGSWTGWAYRSKRGCHGAGQRIPLPLKGGGWEGVRAKARGVARSFQPMSTNSAARRVTSSPFGCRTS